MSDWDWIGMAVIMGHHPASNTFLSHRLIYLPADRKWMFLILARKGDLTELCRLGTLTRLATLSCNSESGWCFLGALLLLLYLLRLAIHHFSSSYTMLSLTANAALNINRKHISGG
ncbi:hypothetical protein FIBSPDRAFT_453500 [Athelia psychrophila]|uniref:Uncharacterized protein n=1 Tax=Athelia psychrophila TaxID=1759441 RepID=A0A166M6G6_9AGAM|nr:hypothetical protein FIBSPDRAFT_453500 [Fibularhizoctonia sp. CBS 109695]